jgi:hypothetical protein
MNTKRFFVTMEISTQKYFTFRAKQKLLGALNCFLKSIPMYKLCPSKFTKHTKLCDSCMNHIMTIQELY